MFPLREKLVLERLLLLESGLNDLKITKIEMTYPDSAQEFNLNSNVCIHLSLVFLRMSLSEVPLFLGFDLVNQFPKIYEWMRRCKEADPTLVEANGFVEKVCEKRGYEYWLG